MARVVLVGLAVLVIGWLVLRQVAGTSDPVSDREALATFTTAARGTVPAGGPVPGVYRYRATGTERGGAGPLVVTRDLPRDARLVVTPRDGGWEAEVAYSRQHIEGARYVVRDGAIRVTWRRTKVTFAGFGRDDRRAVTPPSVFLPAGPDVGADWAEEYRTGDISVRAESRILRRERVAVDGARFETLVIESRSTTSGAHPGTRTETLWWSPLLGLPVRWDVDMDIGGVFAFRARSTLVLATTVPVASPAPPEG